MVQKLERWAGKFRIFSEFAVLKRVSTNQGAATTTCGLLETLVGRNSMSSESF